MPERHDIPALVISLVALVFSSLSWWESHETGKISRSISRANLFVGPATLKVTPSRERLLDDDVEISLKIENVGQATARLIDFSGDCLVTRATLSGESSSAGKRVDADGNYPVRALEQKTIDSLSPHKTLSVGYHLNIPHLKAEDRNRFFPIFFLVKGTYADEAGGQEFTFSQTFSSALMGRKAVQSLMSSDGEFAWGQEMISAALQKALKTAQAESRNKATQH